MRKAGIVWFIGLLVLVAGTAVLAQDTTPPELDDVVAIDGNHIDFFFSEVVDSASAVDPANYNVTSLVNGQLGMGLTIDSIVIEESHISVRLTTIQPLTLFDWELVATVNGVEDTSGNALVSDSLNLMGVPPVGQANWDHPDNYVFKGHVQLADGTPVSDYLIPIHNDGIDGEDYHYGVSTDDIHFEILPDANGDFRVEGLPASVGVNMSNTGDYDISVWDHTVYEPYGWATFVTDSTDSTSRTIVLYPIVEGTGLRGQITDGDGEPIEFWGYSADDVLQITRGDVSVWTHPPSYTDTSANMYYNPLTGDYRARGDLGGGGTYDLAAFLPGTASVQEQASVAPGTMETHNFTLTAPTRPGYLVEIIMDDAGQIPTPDMTDEITLSWQKVSHDSVNSYVVGFWTEDQILSEPNPDSLWTRIAPSLLHVAVPATDSSITLGDLRGPQMTVLTPLELDPMAASGIGDYQKVYWGVYASTWGTDSLNAITLEDHFSGYPEGGLQQLIFPVPDAPGISMQELAYNEVKVWISQSQLETPMTYYTQYYEGNLPGEFQQYHDTLTVDPSLGTIHIEAYVTSDGWSHSDTTTFVIEQTSGVSETDGLPDDFAFHSIYPNPFNPTTTIQIAMPHSAPLTLEVFDVLGRRVATLASGEVFSAGMKRLTFDGKSLSSGLYFVRASVPGEFESIHKIVLMR